MDSKPLNDTLAELDRRVVDAHRRIAYTHTLVQFMVLEIEEMRNFLVGLGFQPSVPHTTAPEPPPRSD